jgi:hypothetical protein
MTAEIVYQPEVPSDVCLTMADGVCFKLHSQVLACSCGTFADALCVQQDGYKTTVEETAQQFQASAGGSDGGAGNWRGFVVLTSKCSKPFCTSSGLQEGLLQHIYQRYGLQHMTEGGVRLSLELARKYDCPALMDKCEDFLCSSDFQLSASPR